MSRKIIILTFIILFFFITLALFLQINGEKNELEERTKIEEVSMKVIDDTVTPNGAEFVITDHYIYPGFGHLYWFNLDYRIEKREWGKWRELEKIKEIDTRGYDISHSTGEDGTWTQKIDWTDTYGELSKGNYRCVKWVTWEDEKLYFEAIFTIE